MTAQQFEFASRADPRLSCLLHVPPPPSFASDPGGHALIVAVHGTERSVLKYRDAFIPLAESLKCVVMAPLFPSGVQGDGYTDGYKYLREGNIRYDLILLDMVAQLEARIGAAFPRFLLFGFSGGGHFVHRFFYLHCRRLLAVSIGAPGGITCIDPNRDWWLGTRNVRALFGIDIDVPALREVPVQLVVGADDTHEFSYDKTAPHYVEGMEQLGRNRIERNHTLRRNYEAHGITVRQDVVPGVAHEGLKVIPQVQDFFTDILNADRATG